jgi:hypothetical protein
MISIKKPMDSLANVRFFAVIYFLLFLAISLLPPSSFANSPMDRDLELAVSRCTTIGYDIDSTDYRDCVREQLRLLSAGTLEPKTTSEFTSEMKPSAQIETPAENANTSCVPDWFRIGGNWGATLPDLCDEKPRPLRSCPPNPRVDWTDCEGTYDYKNSHRLKTYTGEWKWNVPHGYGVLLLTNGDKYIGQFFQNFYHGVGTYKYANGSVYEGPFERGLRTGRGRYTYTDGRVYEGDFKRNKLEGTGTLLSTNGERYVGEFRDNKASGFGTYFFKDGRRYEGQWKNDSWNGAGILFNHDNSILLKGIWKDGKLLTER